MYIARSFCPTKDNYIAFFQIYENHFKDNTRRMSEELFCKFLSVSYKEVEDTRKMISKLFDKETEVLDLYKKDYYIYLINCDEAKQIFVFLKKFFADDKEKIWEVYKRAVEVGITETEKRIQAIIETVGCGKASEVIYRTSISGNLFCPCSKDPVRAMKLIRDYFDKDEAAELLIRNSDCLHLIQAYNYTTPFPRDYCQTEQDEKSEEFDTRMFDGGGMFADFRASNYANTEEYFEYIRETAKETVKNIIRGTAKTTDVLRILSVVYYLEVECRFSGNDELGMFTEEIAGMFFVL